MAKSTYKDDSDYADGVLDVDAELVDDIESLLASGQQAMVLNLVADLHPADMAILISHLPSEPAQKLFEWLPIEQAGDVLPELDSTIRNGLLEAELPSRITALLDELESDDATDVVGELPEDLVQKVLPQLEDEEDVRELLAYDEESAGGLMAREYVSVQSEWTVHEVTEEVRREAEEMEQIYVVYVVDPKGRLEGFITLKKLLLSAAHRKVTEIMKTDFVSVHVNLDQEEVARVMERYDLVALPVLDDEQVLVGRITIDDVVDVIREEAEEDIQLMSGVTGGEDPTDSVLSITRGRLPWLLVGLVGAGLSGFVIGGFEEALDKAVVLAAFIPIMMATAGNVGIQSSAIIVQGLASGELWTTDIFSRLGKETAVAMINGVALALVLALAIIALPMVSDRVAAVISDPMLLALTAGLSLLAVIILATVIGTTVPLLLHRSGIDPAIATGPFITTSNDIIGLAIYFLIATFIYI
ncbi:MAG: magnesium transporter [Bacteroidota bacterium]